MKRPWLEFKKEGSIKVSTPRIPALRFAGGGLLLASSIFLLSLSPMDKGRARADGKKPSAIEGRDAGASADGGAAGKETAPQWEVFRGGQRQAGYRKVTPADKPKLAWAFDMGDAVEATAAISGGVVFVAGVDGRVCALALDVEDKKGKLLWEHRIKAGIRSSPGIKENRVFFGDDFGFVHALDAGTGKEIWKHETEGGAELLSSVNFSGNALLIGSYDGNLYCLDCAGGKPLWTVETGAPVHCSPAISDGRTFVAGCDGLLRVIDVKTGKEVSQMELGENTAASPAVDGDQLFVGTYGSQVKGVDWKSGKELWSYTHPRRRFPYYASVAIDSRMVVAGGRDKLIHGIDRASGKAAWTFPTRSRVESSPVIAGERVICGSSDKNIYMLELSTGKKVWSFEGDGSFVASAALAEGRMVIGCDSGLVYCFELNPGARGGSK